MNYYNLSALINGITSLILACFVFLNNKNSEIHKKFAFFGIAVAFWSFNLFMWSFSDSRATALFWARLLLIGAIFTPSTFLDFVFILVGKDLKPKSVSRKIVYCNYLLSIIFLILSFTPYFLVDARDKLYFKFWPCPGILFIPFLIYFLSNVAYSHFLMYKAMKATTSLNVRNQIRYVFLGTLIGFIGGSTNYFLYYDINIPPVANSLVAVYVATVAYAIIRHHLMDIEVVIKKTLVFASLFTIVFGIFVGVTVLIQEFIGAGNNIIGFAISSIIIILTVRPLEIFLIRTTDKYLFQKKYDYKNLIREFMDELKTMVLNTAGIAQSTIDFLNASIRPMSSAVFMYNKFTSQYDLIASCDFKDKDMKITGGSEFTKILENAGGIITIKADNRLALSKENGQLVTLGMEVVVPLLIHKELIGFLCLGKKKSDEDYSNEDMEALSGLSGALSISLNNAQLFDERADAEKRALVGTIATGINHEVGNPLNIITIKLDTFRILAKEGLLAHKTKEEIIEEVDKITKVCLDSAQRISEITKQVSEFAKPDKKLIFGKVNISEAIDETIAFLKHGMILEGDKIEKKIMCEPVYVFADRGQLKQILFNLIKNASHAIDKVKGKIIVSVDKSNGDEIAIKIIDNGHGMPKEVKDKIFTPFFTTKEPGRGTGLGLALVKIMLDRNNAKIKVDSEGGKGTTFTLIFKGGFL